MIYHHKFYNILKQPKNLYKYYSLFENVKIKKKIKKKNKGWSCSKICIKYNFMLDEFMRIIIRNGHKKCNFNYYKWVNGSSFLTNKEWCHYIVTLSLLKAVCFWCFQYNYDFIEMYMVVFNW